MKTFFRKLSATLAVIVAVGALCPEPSAAQEAPVTESPKALWQAFQSPWNRKAYEEALVPLRKTLALERGTMETEEWLRAQRYEAECLILLKRHEDARKAYESFLATEVAPDVRQSWWFGIARTYEAEENFAAAIDTLERVISAQADKAENKNWFAALEKIADLRIKQGDLAVALEAARDCFALADSMAAYKSASLRIQKILRAIDKNDDRVTPFLDYQRLGPFGEDGEKGTADDLVNPLDAVQRAPQPAARLAAFAAAKKTLGCDTLSLMQRGLILSLEGKREEACAILLEACRRASGNEISPAYSTLVFVGARGVQGHQADLRKFATFLRFGPEGSPESGPLSDPFEAFTLPAWTAVKPTAAEIADYRYLIERLGAIAINTTWPKESKGRSEAGFAVLRLHSLLGDWGDPSVMRWYTDRLATETKTAYSSPFTHGYWAASRAGRVDWGAALKNYSELKPGQYPGFAVLMPHKGVSPFVALEQLEASIPTSD